MPALLRSAEARAEFADALHLLDAELLEDLQPDVAADLEPITDPAFQAWAIRTLDRVAAGEPVEPNGIAPEQLVAVGKAVERLGPLC